ncbi:MAG: ABC transporter substrate-binding protein, partial [Microlunatus sp.]|nr:ABC transporter substrate-binding protein [Microlunatus sp.]
GKNGIQVGKFQSSRTDYLVMNNDKKPFDDINVRKAIAQSVDRQALIKTVLFGTGTPAGSYLTPALWSHDDSIKALPYDLNAAKADLAKSSVPNGFSTTMMIGSGDADELTAAQLVQNALSKIGIKVQLKTLDPSAVSAAKHSGDYEMGFTYCTTDIIDPDEIIRFGGLYDGGSNALYTQYKNPELEKLADQASTNSDRAKRTAIYHRIQEQVNADQPLVPLYYSPALYSYSDTVHDFKTLPTGNYNLVDVWLSK